MFNESIANTCISITHHTVQSVIVNKDEIMHTLDTKAIDSLFVADDVQAIVRDDVETITWMLHHKLVDPAIPDELGNTAAHLAVFHDSPRCSQ